MKKIWMVPALVSLMGCASKKATTEAAAPAGGGGFLGFFSSSKTQLRPYRVQELPNGMKIFFVRDESLPRVSLQASVRAGVRQESSDSGGLNALMAAMIDQGTSTRSATQLSDAFNSLGTEFGASPGDDATTLSASSLTPDADQLLALFADVLMNPIFPEKEIDRARELQKSALQRRVDNPSAYAWREYEAYLFGSHPYGRDDLGSMKSLNSIGRADLIRHYLAWYRPNNASLAVAGRYGPDFEQKVVDVFSKWARRDIKDAPPSSPPQVEQLAVRLVSKPGLVQTQIRFGRISVEVSNPDYLKLRLVAEAFGGGPAARLMQRVRDDLGLTYSVSSMEDGRKTAGAFTISTFTKNESAGRTIAEVLNLYRTFAEKGITESELAMAKAQMIGQYPRGIETADAMASQLMALDFYGLPLSHLADFPQRVEAVTLKDANEAIRKYFAPEGLKVLVYGDEKAIGPQLSAWRPEVVKVR